MVVQFPTQEDIRVKNSEPRLCFSCQYPMIQVSYEGAIVWGCPECAQYDFDEAKSRMDRMYPALLLKEPEVVSPLEYTRLLYTRGIARYHESEKYKKIKEG